MFPISKAPPKSKIVVKANETDVLIILLATIHNFPQMQIWLAGSSTKKSSKRDLDCINCTDLARKLCLTLCLGLPAFHAFTGCDYTAAFYNKEKVKPLLLEDNIQRVQEFTAILYEIKQCYNINDARYQLLQNTYSNKKNKEHFIKKIKGIDSNLIPSCWISLKRNILRTIYVNSIWFHATDACCNK